MSGPQNPLAFPVATASHIHSEGMTLRDWFAGQALVGLIAHASGEDPYKAPGMAWKIADAMLAERDKETDQ